MLWAFFVHNRKQAVPSCGRQGTIGKEGSCMNHHSENFALLQLVSCALVLLLLAGMFLFRSMEAKKTVSSYDTMDQVVYRVDEDNTQGHAVTNRV